MNEVFERLTALLIEKNEHLTEEQARVWVELLWEDFESTYAKVGKYNGAEKTEHVVMQYIQNHGLHLHKVMTSNLKYQHLLNQKN